MSRRFLNPYHFVPADEVSTDFRSEPDGVDAQTFFKKANIAADLGTRSHDRYCKESFSGRIICRLTAKTPLIVGGKRHVETDEHGKPTDYTRIEPYRFAGRLALPATSLKGMLSTIAEAASFSALRVLNDVHPISYRQSMGEALSAMGVMERDTDGELVLRPIALPTMKKTGTRLEYPNPDSLWRKAFPNFVTLKVKYRGRWQDANQPKKAWAGGSFDDLIRAVRNDNIILAEKKGKVCWVYGQFSNTNRPECEGYDHDLKTHGAKIETGRKFEIFLPDPAGAHRNPQLRLKRGVLDAFHALADDARENALPEHKVPYAPSCFRYDGNEKFCLREGMTVYFDIEADGEGKPVVSKIQLSSIWRDGVKKAGESKKAFEPLKSFFSPDRLPMHAGRDNHITPAEWLFGFVREDGGDAEPVRAGHAGRVRLSNAALAVQPPGTASEDALLYGADDDWNEIDPSLSGHDLAIARRRKADLGGYIRLRELSSPKPPSPQLYFRAKPGPHEPIAKRKLDITKHKPQGIKLYVHHHVADGEAPDYAILNAARTGLKISDKDDPEKEWASAKRKVAVKPVRSGAEFWFHLDFDNLSRAELELLCFSLKPSREFHHRLGLAKPLGLGTIEIDPVAFFQIDRAARYERQNLLGSTRYCAAHGATDVIADLPDFYATECKVAVTAQSDLAVSSLADAYRASLEKTAAGQEVWSALSTLGAFPRAPEDDGSWLPVHTPLADGQNVGDVTGEQETFEWFSNNSSHLEGRDARRDPQFLRPIGADGRLPALWKNRPLKRSK